MRKKTSARSPRTTLILQLIVGTILLLLVGGLGYGVWYVTRLPSLTITTVEVSGGSTVPHALVAETVSEVLEGTYVGLVPRRFSYVLPEQAIRQAVMSVPRVRTVAVVKIGRQTIEVSFSEYEPYALWCDVDVPERCVFIDDTGYAFAEAPPLRGGAFPRIAIEGVILLTGKSIPVIKQLPEAFALRDAFFETYHFPVQRIVFASGGDVNFELVSGAALYTNTEYSTTETLRNLATILESADFTHLTADNFKYIDLRFGNKVFVNEELAAPQGEAASSTDELLEEVSGNEE